MARTGENHVLKMKAIIMADALFCLNRNYCRLPISDLLTDPESDPMLSVRIVGGKMRQSASVDNPQFFELAFISMYPKLQISVLSLRWNQN
jgi:hypothetical protein